MKFNYRELAIGFLKLKFVILWSIFSIPMMLLGIIMLSETSKSVEKIDTTIGICNLLIILLGITLLLYQPHWITLVQSWEKEPEVLP